MFAGLTLAVRCTTVVGLAALTAAPLAGQQRRDSAAKQASHTRMVQELAAIAERSVRDHKYHGDDAAKALWAEMAQLGDKAPWKLRLDGALAHLRLGATREGIAILQAADDALVAKRIDGDVDARNSVRFYLGMAWLRLAENENCCARNAPESCILPLRDAALHTAAPEGATNAIPWFEAVIANTPKGDYWQLSSIWLLNLAHMALDQWPDGVPAAHRLPASTFTSSTSFPAFPNVAGRVGLDTFGMLGGVIVDDFDGDLDLDLMVSLWSAAGQLRYLRNDGDGRFTDRTDAAGLRGIISGINLIQADYDNDGDLDAFVSRGAWLYDGGRHPNSLLQNQGDGTFLDVTFAAGLGEVHFPTSTADWGDVDGDGDLDLYVGNEASAKIAAPCQLFRNEGDGTFFDIADRAGVQNLGYTKGVAFGDYDDDGRLDLYVSNLHEPNRLYRNAGNGRFVDMAPKLGMHEPVESFGAWFWDVDNDGALDLFCAAYSTGIGDIAAAQLGVPRPHPDRMRLWRGDGKGGFTEVGKAMGLDVPALPMGANFGDLDNDGFLDVHLGTGDPYYYSLMPNLVFKNDGGTRFVDVTMAGGFGHLQKGHGCAFADLDADGDLDLFSIQGGAYPGDAAHDALYENPGFGNHWLGVLAEGRDSNRSAIGARLRVVFDENGVERSVWRDVGSGGCFGANPLRQHLGLGKATALKRLEVRWPKSGATQTLRDLPIDATIRVVEGQDGFVKLELPQTMLGGAK
ncbi:MAG: CRTAC1 family protein [Planctomycetes bacterium]|nr:CRTAC1 family protein [Planctomycetota bacterium]